MAWYRVSKTQLITEIYIIDATDEEAAWERAMEENDLGEAVDRCYGGDQDIDVDEPCLSELRAFGVDVRALGNEDGRAQR